MVNKSSVLGDGALSKTVPPLTLSVGAFNGQICVVAVPLERPRASCLWLVPGD